MTKLSEEEIARRQKNVEGLYDDGEDFGGRGASSFLANWRKVGSVDLVIHTGQVPITHLHQHQMHVCVKSEATRNQPEKWGIYRRQPRCMEAEAWHKFKRIKHELLAAPTCPKCRLVLYVEAHPELYGVPIFRFEAEGCESVEYMGADLCGEASRRDSKWAKHDAYKKFMGAQQRRAMCVIPVRIAKQPVEQYEVKIAMEGYAVADKLRAAVVDAIERFGEDRADIVRAPAVYRLAYDKARVGADMYSVQFLPEVDAPDEVVALWEAPLPSKVAADFERTTAPMKPEDVFSTLRDALVADIDLERVMFGSGGRKAVQPEASKATESLCGVCGAPQYATRSGMTCKNGHGGAPSKDEVAAPPAQTSAPKTGGRGPARKPAPKPEAPPAEPCSGCGTPWPTGVRRCPGHATKGCDYVDDTAPEREPGADDEVDKIIGAGNKLPF